MANAQRALLAFAVVLGGAMLACGSAPGPSSALNGETGTSGGAMASNGASNGKPTRDVHSIYRSRCGNCHVRVEPGTHTRAQLETAFARHHNRVKMNDAEWSNMVDFLAADAPTTTAKASAPSAEK
ncbi:MAG: hypothetical protein ABI551_14150 [Polyangiaceae bacterium]